MWKLQNIDKIKPLPNINMTFGKAMHTVLQEYLDKMYNHSIVKADEIDLASRLEEEMYKEYKESLEKNNNIHFSSKIEMREFYEDGLEILLYFKKKRINYFSSKKVHLVGIEYPLKFQVHEKFPNIMFLGFIDVIMYDETDDTFRIIDFKTSSYGWKDKHKKDTSKTSQLLLYKEAISKLYNVDIDSIQVEFVILKRKLPTDCEYPIPRIQVFSPVSGKTKRKEINGHFKSFVEDCFDENGPIRDKKYTQNIGDSCIWCPFKSDNILCPR